ncbi:MAG: HNH endonuclease, partial [Bacteroidales bacterium]|nr:HNH endonuclease [Bacteroidales bacterium]
YTNKGTVITQRIDRYGYKIVQLYIGKKRYVKKVHRLVYSAFNGEIKDNLVVDHINNNKADNRIVNLQVISNSENLGKDRWRTKRNKSYPRGVNQNNHSKMFVSSICINKKVYYLGSFNTVKEAGDAYKKARIEYDKYGLLPKDMKRVRHVLNDGYKVCSCCGENKPISDYYVSRGRVQGKCKDCFKKDKIARYKNKLNQSKP